MNASSSSLDRRVVERAADSLIYANANANANANAEGVTERWNAARLGRVQREQAAGSAIPASA